MITLRTPRLVLIQGTREVLEAELASRDALGSALGVDVPASWPPELYDADAVRWTIRWLGEHAEQADWSLYYVATVDGGADGRPGLVGVVGYKGGPDAEGIVEIGYGVVPEQRRRGFASEAVSALLARAFADPRVVMVTAHTLPGLDASIGVLRATGFTYEGPGNDPHEPTAIRFILPREEYRGAPPAPAPERVSPPLAAVRPSAT
jgi:ribosomal-protein-alanine N-acetyltransferase